MVERIMLLPQQHKAIQRLASLKVGALFMEPGTGKTRTAVELVNSAPEEEAEEVFWFGPLRTLDEDSPESVVHEIHKHGGFNRPCTYVGIESISQSDRIYLEVLQAIQGTKCFMVVDESIKIKNFDAKRSQRAIELGKLCQYKLILNGTPITLNLMDIWAQFEFLNPKILNMRMAEFESTFCETVKVTTRHNGRRPQTRQYIAKYHNVDYLYSIIQPYVYECSLELLIQQRYTEVYYELDEEMLQEYERLKAKYLDNEMLMRMNNRIFIEMTQKMQHGYCCTESKFTALQRIIEKHGAGNIIVYTKFINSREAVEKRYSNLAVLSYGKHSYGLNLQKYYITVYWDKTFNYGQRTQSEFRTFRTAQENDCWYYNLTGNVGLEKMINENIKKKQNLLDYFKQVGAEQIKKEL